MTLYIIPLNAQPWSEKMKIVASDRAFEDKFGYSVSLSDNFAIVGAFWDDKDLSGANIMTDAGSAYIFERKINGDWVQVQKLIASDRDINDVFATSVCISGDYAIIGAVWDDEDEFNQNYMSKAGSAYIFERDGNGIWSEVQKIVASDRGIDDKFGFSVSISGNYAIVGAYNEDENISGGSTVEDAGSAYIFERDEDGNWMQAQKIVASERAENDLFGWNVSISENYALVSATREDEDHQDEDYLWDAGAAYIFKRDKSGEWSQTQKIVASDRGTLDQFGRAIHLYKDRIIIGVRAEDEDASGNNTMDHSGSAYIFEKNNNETWEEVQKIVASDRTVADRFGASVSINSNYAIIGAYWEDDDILGENPMNKSGSAYIFKRGANSNWSQIQKIVASDRSAEDQYGFAVTIDGNYTMVGAYTEDEDASSGDSLESSGSAYIYELASSTGFYDANIYSKLLVCPSPTHGRSIINLGRHFNKMSLTIRNILGQEISSYQFKDVEIIEFEINNIPGIYMLNLRDEIGNSKTLKILKN